MNTKKHILQDRLNRKTNTNIVRATHQFLLFTFLLFTITSNTTKAQIITTIAGNGISGYTGDGGPATLAEMDYPSGLTFDNYGKLYIGETLNQTVRSVSVGGIMNTFAGMSPGGFGGNGAPATSALLMNPAGVKADAFGNVFIVDHANNCIRKVNTSGIITTVAGSPIGAYGYTGDGGPATAALLSAPVYVTFDHSGNLYISDWGNNVVRMIDASGTITTVVGNAVAGYSGDGGAATAAELNSPVGLAFDANGNLFIADNVNNVIREVNTSGIISTVVGNGTSGYTGDGGPATAAEIYLPSGITFDIYNNLYIADYANHVVRIVYTSGIISTFAGTGGFGYTGDGGLATAAQFYLPWDVVFDASGNLFISDYGIEVIRKVSAVPHNCVDSSKITMASTTDIYGNCTYTATANIFTTNSIVGYQWTSIGAPIILHSHLPTSSYTFTLPAGTSGIANCLVNLVDPNYLDPSSACCQAVLSQSVTCAPLCPAFTPATNVVGSGGDLSTNCQFNLTANALITAGWTMARYDWYIYPSATPIYTGFGPALHNSQLFTFPLGFTGVIQVIFKAVNTLGDTCTTIRTIHLDCHDHVAYLPAHNPGNTGISNVADPAASDAIAIFPNPTDNQVTVTSTKNDIDNVQIIDVNGQKVGEYSYQHSQSIHVSLDKLPPGTYLLRVNNTTSKVVTKSK